MTYLTVTCSDCRGRGWQFPWFWRDCSSCLRRGNLRVFVNPAASFEVTPWGVVGGE